MTTINTALEVYAGTLVKLLKLDAGLYLDISKLIDREIEDEDLTTIKSLLYRLELSTWHKDKCYRDIYDVATHQDFILDRLQKHVNGMGKVEITRSTTPEPRF